MRPRMMDYPRLIRRLMDELEEDQVAFGRRIGVSQGTVSRWLHGGKIEVENRDRIDAEASRVLRSPQRRRSSIFVSVVGFAGAGDDGINFSDGQGPFGQARAPLGAGDKTVAVQIRGTSLGPLFDGWVAFYNSRQDPPQKSLDGKICVVGVAGGRVLVKKLAIGDSGRWHLISNTQPPIFNAELEWAAEIFTFEPPSCIITEGG